MPSRSSSSHAASRLSLTLGRQTAALPIAYSYLGEPSEPLMAGWGPLAGPLTVNSSRFDSRRPFPVQIAPASSHGRSARRMTDTSSLESGSTVTSHRSRRQSTRWTPVTEPPVTSREWSRKSVYLILMGQQNLEPWSIRRPPDSPKRYHEGRVINDNRQQAGQSS